MPQYRNVYNGRIVEAIRFDANSYTHKAVCYCGQTKDMAGRKTPHTHYDMHGGGLIRELDIGDYIVPSMNNEGIGMEFYSVSGPKFVRMFQPYDKGSDNSMPDTVSRFNLKQFCTSL